MNMTDQKYARTNIRFSNQDALTGLQSVSSSFVDLVLTDPPYGIADSSKLTKKGSKIVTTSQAWGADFQDNWDTIDDYYQWLKPFIAEFVRVLKDNGSLILFLDRKYTGLITHYLERDFELNFKNKIYFKKKNPVPSIRKNNYRSAMEEAVWFSKGRQYTFNFGDQADMGQVYEGPIGKKKTAHPTEKYRWMIEPLIKNHSKPGDVVLDAFAGSATTLLVAQQYGRHSIGFEKNPAFYEMAKARITLECGFPKPGMVLLPNVDELVAELNSHLDMA